MIWRRLAESAFRSMKILRLRLAFHKSVGPDHLDEVAFGDHFFAMTDQDQKGLAAYVFAKLHSFPIRTWAWKAGRYGKADEDHD
jgi:hypothetical protein